MYSSRITVLLILAIISCTFAGCSSPADKAAQKLVDLNKEISKLTKSKDPEDVAKAMALAPEVQQALLDLMKEMKKMSPEEQQAFAKKWQGKADLFRK